MNVNNIIIQRHQMVSILILIIEIYIIIMYLVSILILIIEIYIIIMYLVNYKNCYFEYIIQNITERVYELKNRF
jgi:hypothetical protein